MAKKKVIEDLLRSAKELGTDEISNLIDELDSKRQEKRFNYFHDKILKKISKQQYNELKERIRKLTQFNKKLLITCPIDIYCSIYGGFYGKEMICSVEPSYDYEFNDRLDEDCEMKTIKQELEKEFKDIKETCVSIGINSPDGFINKVLYELQQEEDNIREIIE